MSLGFEATALLGHVVSHRLWSGLSPPSTQNAVLTKVSWLRSHCTASTCAFESTVLSSESPMFSSESLQCFELCFVQLHRRLKAPYANLVYIYIYVYVYVHVHVHVYVYVYAYVYVYTYIASQIDDKS
jgi:hypothetical protein